MSVDPQPSITHGAALDLIEENWVKSEQGRARNARIAAVATTYALLITLVMIVCLLGWQDTTRALDTRNRAVRELTTDAQRRAHLDDCQDVAFADVVDQALTTGDIPPKALTKAYAECAARYPAPR